jgi:hypothetical protein
MSKNNKQLERICKQERGDIPMQLSQYNSSPPPNEKGWHFNNSSMVLSPRNLGTKIEGLKFTPNRRLPVCSWTDPLSKVLSLLNPNYRPLFTPIPVRNRLWTVNHNAEQSTTNVHSSGLTFGGHFCNEASDPVTPLNELAQKFGMNPNVTQLYQRLGIHSSSPRNGKDTKVDYQHQESKIDNSVLTSNSALAVPTECSHGKKRVRKQTSFAKTDVRSEECSEYELPGNTTFQLQKQDGIRIDLESNDNHPIVNVFEPRIANTNGYEKESRFINCNDHQENPAQSPSNSPERKMVGQLTHQERRVKVQNYLDKKRKRKGKSNVRYGCRQDLAHKRFRFQGRFIKLEDLEEYKGKYIIDFKARKLLKPIFHIEKCVGNSSYIKSKPLSKK